MTAITCWLCDHTGELFRDKESYLRHLKRIAKGRLLNRWAAREADRVRAEHSAIYRCSDFQAIGDYVTEHYASISFQRRSGTPALRIEDIDFVGDVSWAGGQTKLGWAGNWVVTVSDYESGWALKYGLEALGVMLDLDKHYRLTEAIQNSRGERVRRIRTNFHVYADQPWVNLAVAEKLRKGENAITLLPHQLRQVRI